MVFIPGHTTGKALSPKTSQKHKDAWESETGTTDYFSSRGLVFTWRVYPDFLLFSGFGSWHLCYNWYQHHGCVYVSPSDRLTDVVSGALGSGAEEAESSVMIFSLPGSDWNDRDSSHYCVPGRPQQKGGGGLSPSPLSAFIEDTFGRVVERWWYRNPHAFPFVLQATA